MRLIARHVVEVVGYATRAASYNATGGLAPYLIQAIFLILPPVFFAATLYMVYSRIVRAVDGTRFSPITPRWTTWIFVIADGTCFNIQSNGGGLLAKDKTVKIGGYIIVAGLILQILVFACFLVLCFIFHGRYGRYLAETGTRSDVPWRSCFHMLYATSAAILVRNIYRVVEFVMGKDGYLQIVEWPVYAFDAALMLLVMIAFFVWYPSDLKPPPSRDSMVELMSNPEDGQHRPAAMKARSAWTTMPGGMLVYWIHGKLQRSSRA